MDYKAPKFLSALKHFLTSCMTQDNVVLPVELDRFDVYSWLYIESPSSMVTGHSNVWQKIHARSKVTANGHKAKSPARFDMAFVWDEGHQGYFFSGRGSKYLHQEKLTVPFITIDHYRLLYITICDLCCNKCNNSIMASIALPPYL